MAIRPSRYFNNPQLAAGFQNIASMFEPMSGTDAHGYAQAEAVKAEASRIAQMYANPNDPNFDRRNIAMGNYAPTSSFYAQDMNDATVRRGQDVTAQTSITNNRLDNVAGFFDNIPQGNVRPTLPGDIASMFGLPELPAEYGMAPDRTKAVVEGDILSTLSPQDQRSSVMSSVGVENVVGPDGKPQIVNRPDAAGMELFVNPGSPAAIKTENYTTSDGRHGTAWFDPTIRTYRDVNTQEVVENISSTFNSQVQDTAAGIKTTESQDRMAYAGKMAEGATLELIQAADRGEFPTSSDFQLFQAMRVLPASIHPLLVGQISPHGQLFYQNLRTAITYQLMAQSGQAVTEPEVNRKLLELVPTPGEDPTVTEAKMRQIRTYLETVHGLAKASYQKIDGEMPVDPTAPVDQPVASSTGFKILKVE